jgi:hypothetical protein
MRYLCNGCGFHVELAHLRTAMLLHIHAAYRHALVRHRLAQACVTDSNAAASYSTIVTARHESTR